MSDAPKPNRLRRAKSEVTHSRSTVNTLRDGFRDRFFNRLRSSRSKSVDRFRQICEDIGENVHYESVSDLRQALLGDKEAIHLLLSEEINRVLIEVEKEMAQVSLQEEGDQYVKQDAVETQDIVERHLHVCTVCGTLSEEVDVCAKCSTLFQVDFRSSS